MMKQVSQDQWAQHLTDNYPRAVASENGVWKMEHKDTDGNVVALVVYPTDKSRPHVYFTDEPGLTLNQIDTITDRYYRLSTPTETLDEYMASAVPTFGCDGAVALPYAGMWLCIETDGYAHS